MEVKHEVTAPIDAIPAVPITAASVNDPERPNPQRRFAKGVRKLIAAQRIAAPSRSSKGVPLFTPIARLPSFRNASDAAGPGKQLPSAATCMAAAQFVEDARQGRNPGLRRAQQAGAEAAGKFNGALKSAPLAGLKRSMSFSALSHIDIESSSWAAMLLQSLWYRMFLQLIVLLHCGLAWWEYVPSSIGDSQYTLPSFSWTVGGLELIPLSVYVCDQVLTVYAFGRGIYADKKWEIVFAVVGCACCIDWMLFYACGLVSMWRFSRPFRPLLSLTKVPRLRRLLASLLKTGPHILQAMVLLGVIVCFFGVLGVALFEPAQVDGYSTFNDNFNDAGSGILAIFVLSTTENFPSVMYPGLDERPFVSPVFFIAAILSLLWIVLPLFQAVVYQRYSQSRDEAMMANKVKGHASLIFAYQTLMGGDGTAEMDRNTFKAFISYLLPKASKDAVELMFAALDVDGAGTITVAEWLRLLTVLELEVGAASSNRNIGAGATITSNHASSGVETYTCSWRRPKSLVSPGVQWICILGACACSVAWSGALQSSSDQQCSNNRSDGSTCDTSPVYQLEATALSFQLIALLLMSDQAWRYATKACSDEETRSSAPNSGEATAAAEDPSAKPPVSSQRSQSYATASWSSEVISPPSTRRDSGPSDNQRESFGVNAKQNFENDVQTERAQQSSSSHHLTSSASAPLLAAASASYHNQGSSLAGTSTFSSTFYSSLFQSDGARSYRRNIFANSWHHIGCCADTFCSRTCLKSRVHSLRHPRLFALHFSRWFTFSHSRLFDCVILIVGISGSIGSMLNVRDHVPLAVADIFESTRALRFMRVLVHFPLMAPLLASLQGLLPLMAAATAVYVALMYTFAVIGQALLSNVNPSMASPPLAAPTGLCQNCQQYTFATLNQAFLQLLQMSVGNNWNSILYPNMITEGGGSRWYALYFCAYRLCMMDILFAIIESMVVDAHARYNDIEKRTQMEQQLSAALTARAKAVNAVTHASSGRRGSGADGAAMASSPGVASAASGAGAADAAATQYSLRLKADLLHELAAVEAAVQKAQLRKLKAKVSSFKTAADGAKSLLMGGARSGRRLSVEALLSRLAITPPKRAPPPPPPAASSSSPQPKTDGSVVLPSFLLHSQAASASVSSHPATATAVTNVLRPSASDSSLASSSIGATDVEDEGKSAGAVRIGVDDTAVVSPMPAAGSVQSSAATAARPSSGRGLSILGAAMPSRSTGARATELEGGASSSGPRGMPQIIASSSSTVAAARSPMPSATTDASDNADNDGNEANRIYGVSTHELQLLETALRRLERSIDAEQPAGIATGALSGRPGMSGASAASLLNTASFAWRSKG